MYNIVMVTLFSLGKGPSLRPRSSHMIRASKWSVGTETMDRNLTIYNNYKRFIEPLGEANMWLLHCILSAFFARIELCAHLAWPGRRRLSFRVLQ